MSNSTKTTAARLAASDHPRVMKLRAELGAIEAKVEADEPLTLNEINEYGVGALGRVTLARRFGLPDPKRALWTATVPAFKVRALFAKYRELGDAFAAEKAVREERARREAEVDRYVHTGETA